jgi:hypothetical protein
VASPVEGILNFAAQIPATNGFFPGLVYDRDISKDLLSIRRNLPFPLLSQNTKYYFLDVSRVKRRRLAFARTPLAIFNYNQSSVLSKTSRRSVVGTPFYIWKIVNHVRFVP